MDTETIKNTLDFLEDTLNESKIDIDIKINPNKILQSVKQSNKSHRKNRKKNYSTNNKINDTSETFIVENTSDLKVTPLSEGSIFNYNNKYMNYNSSQYNDIYNLALNPNMSHISTIEESSKNKESSNIDGIVE